MSNKDMTDIKAFSAVYEALEPLEKETRVRVLTAVATMLDITTSKAKSSTTTETEVISEGEYDIDEDNGDRYEFNMFAELYSRAEPGTNPDKALVAAYWLQVCQGGENFSASSVNGELTNLGHKLSNVTASLSFLIKKKPQLVLQVKKSGKSRQARKIYKLSETGIEKVRGMIGE